MPPARHLFELVVYLLFISSPVPLAILFASNKIPSNRKAPWASYFFSVISVWLVLQTFITLSLGTLRLLNTWALAGVHLIVFICGTFILWRQKVLNRRLFPEGRPFLEKDKVTIIVLMTILFLYSVFIADLTFRYPISEYDSCHVYMPTIAHWCQTGSLDRLLVYNNFKFYPMNPTAISAAFFFPFNEDFAILTPQMIFWLMIGLSVYLISLELGAARVQGAACASLALLIQLLVRKVYALQLDLSMTAFFASGMYATLLYRRTKSPWVLAILFGLSGMLLGTKTPGMLYTFLILATLLAMNIKRLWRWARRRGAAGSKSSGSSAAAAIALGLIAFLILGGYWYLRNTIDYGDLTGINKFNLRDRPVSAHDVLEYFSETTLLNTFQPLNSEHWLLLLKNIPEHLGISFIALLILAALSPIILFVKAKTVVKSHLVVLYILLTILLLFYVIIPTSGGIHHDAELHQEFGRNFRYGFPFLIAFAVIAALAATRFRVPGDALVAIVAISALQFIYGAWHLIFFALVSVLLLPAVFRGASRILSGIKFPEVRWLRFALWTTIILISFLILGLYTHSVREIRELERIKAYGPAYEFVNRTEAGESIAYAEFMGHMVYYIYERSLSNTVVIIHDDPPSLQSLVEELERQGINLLAVGPPTRDHPNHQTLSWVEDSDGPFLQMTQGDPRRVPVIYRLKPEY